MVCCMRAHSVSFLSLTANTSAFVTISVAMREAESFGAAALAFDFDRFLQMLDV